MTEDSKKLLLKLARDSIAARFAPLQLEIPDAPELQEKRGVFVTLHRDGELRGCIGYVRGYKSIVQSVAEMAQNAAFQDSRFPPLRQDELSQIQIEISILSQMTPVDSTTEIVIGRDGLLLQHPYGSGLLLPQVPIEWGWDLESYLYNICRKAGLNKGAWKDEGAKLYRFSAEVFGEAEILA